MEADATFRGYVQRFLISRCANYSTLITIERTLGLKHKTQLSEALVAMRLLRPLCADRERTLHCLCRSAHWTKIAKFGPQGPSSLPDFQCVKRSLFLECRSLAKKECTLIFAPYFINKCTPSLLFKKKSGTLLGLI